MSEISFEDLAADLQGWAGSRTAHEQAAVELLIWHETWRRRPDFKGACITQRAAGLVAIINWEKAREFIDRGCTQRGHRGLPASSSQRRLLDFAVVLGENMFGLSSMGVVHQWHMAAAFAKACGCRLEGPIPEPGHSHPDFIPGDPGTCGACARLVQDEGRERRRSDFMAPRRSAARPPNCWQRCCWSSPSASPTRTMRAACWSGCTSRAYREVASERAAALVAPQEPR